MAQHTNSYADDGHPSSQPAESDVPDAATPSTPTNPGTSGTSTTEADTAAPNASHATEVPEDETVPPQFTPTAQ